MIPIVGKMLLRLFLLALFYSGVALLSFENGSYTDVVVAFDRGFMWTRKQLDNLENLIKVASRVLYNATHGLAYFKEVIILANGGWDYRNERIIGRDIIYSRADIWIGSSNVAYGSPDVFNLQTGECGEPGKFIFLSDRFVRDISENTTELAARRLVQEWVRYRYGVFDEQGSFQWEGNQISPETCADGIQGWAMTEALDRCTLDCGRVRSDCRFFPDIKKNSSVESSLMSLPELPDVKHFCNNSNHNKRAPFMQNRMCNSKSIMEIIHEHEDFKDAHWWLDSTMKVPLQETKLIQKFSRVKGLRIAFVMESSKMMEEANGVQEVQHFIQRFFVHLAPRSARARFIKFSNEIKPLWEEWWGWWIPVGDKSKWQKDRILNVSTRVGSPSATPDIDEALKYAYDEYGEYLPVIILISTGHGKVDENKQYNSWKKYNRRIATIHSISVGQRLNWKLDHLSQKHGGDSYFLGDAKNRGRGEPHTFNMDMAILASMQSISDNDHEQPVVIRYEQLRKNADGEYPSYYFQVEDGVGKDLVVTLSQDEWIRLINPTRGIRSITHQYGFGSSAESISVDDAQPGKWELDLKRDAPDMLEIMITATPRCNVRGGWIWARAWIVNVKEDKKGNRTKGYHRIYAEVKKGYNPVINAIVIATVQIMDRQNPINVTLRDNGGVPDVLKDDGIYSNFFPVTERPAGRPIVIVRVSNDDGKAGIKIASCKKWKSTYGMLDEEDYKGTIDKFGASKSRFSKEDFATYARTRSCFKERKKEERICTVPLPLPFTRAAMANSPILFAMSEDEVGRTPPATIWDLKVVHEFMRGRDFFALLQWTSPEHPRPNTTVVRIEVCGSRNWNSVTLKECERTENIIYIVHDIEPAGELQQFEVKILRSKVEDSARKVHSLYLALRAKDEKGNAGGMSNIAEAFFERPDVEGVEGKGEAAKGKAESRSWVVWTVVTVVVIVAAVIGAVGYLMWKKNKNKGMMPNATVIFQQKEESEHSH